MQLGLEGKVVLVTGGSQGIGRATAWGFVEEGASVAICARGQEGIDETIAAAPGRGRDNMLGIAADLTQGADILRVAESVRDRFGSIDILINNAGSARPGSFLEITDEAWLEDWTLKFFGYMRMARAVLPIMKTQGGGVIVNVIGTGGLRPVAGYMVGGAANAALNHFTKALADEGAEASVRVVGINPGPILTERLLLFLDTLAPGGGSREETLRNMTPLGRAGEPKEVADLALFLASPRAAFIHGANITIDGGANPGLMG